MPNLNPVIDKSSSGILPWVYRYSYVTNNPLKYTDPSGYTYYRKRFDWENSVMEGMNFSAGAGGGKNGQIDPFPPILIDHPNAGVN